MLRFPGFGCPKRKISPKCHAKSGVKNRKSHTYFTLLGRVTQRIAQLWRDEFCDFTIQPQTAPPFRSNPALKSRFRGRFLVVFARFRPFWVKTAKIDSKSAPLEGIALDAWRTGGGGLRLEGRSQDKLQDGVPHKHTVATPPPYDSPVFLVAQPLDRPYRALRRADTQTPIR